MERIAIISAGVLFALAATGCSTAGARIRGNPALFDSLDPATQSAIKRGEVRIGYTPEMVQLALGKPTLTATGAAGTNEASTWIYRDVHRNENDYVIAGYRRRVVFDPVRRGNVIVMEPLDAREEQRLAPRSLHIGFRDGRVSSIQRVEDQ